MVSWSRKRCGDPRMRGAEALSELASFAPSCRSLHEVKPAHGEVLAAVVFHRPAANGAFVMELTQPVNVASVLVPTFANAPPLLLVELTIVVIAVDQAWLRGLTTERAQAAFATSLDKSSLVLRAGSETHATKGPVRQSFAPHAVAAHSSCTRFRPTTTL